MKRKLKILQVSGGAGFGGHTYVLLQLTKRLTNEGYEVVVNTSDKTTIEQLKKLNVRIISIKEMGREINPYRDLVSLLKLIRIMKQERFDIVHTHTSKGRFLGRIVAKLSGVPIVIDHVHGFAFEASEWGILKRFVYLMAEKFAAYFQDQFIFVNDEDRKIAEREKILRPGRRGITIKNGVDLTRFKARLT